jgi:amidase
MALAVGDPAASGSGELWRLDATAQAALVRRREVSPDELIDAALARIERLNPRINAVIALFPDVARRQARDPRTRDAPFAGVPMLLKDGVQELAGTPYTLATPLLRDLGYRSKRTTEFARRLRRAGFVILGKTNLPELSSGVTTEPEAFGPTRNPWALDRTASGSSGGSAAAVAAGMVPVAHGGDATGSLRFPAAACGVATLKPTRGLIPHRTPAGQPDPYGVWTDFVLARSVRDLRGILALVRSDTSVVAPRRPRRPLRVGLLTEDPMTRRPVDPACIAGVERAGDALRDLGHHVEHAHPAALSTFLRPLGGGTLGYARVAQKRWLERVAGRPLRTGDVSASFLAAAEAGAKISRARVYRSVAQMRAAVAPLLDWWRDFDLLVTPTLRQPAWPLGLPDDGSHQGFFTFPASFTGQPAVSLPLAWSPAGLPVGVQILADLGRDELLLDVSADLEGVFPWAEAWPPIALEG